MSYCPYCKADLTNVIDYKLRWDHDMLCPECLQIIVVDYDFYIEGPDETEIDIFDLKKTTD